MPKKDPHDTNSQFRKSDFPVAALRFAHGHVDSRPPEPPAQSASSDAGDVVCQGTFARHAANPGGYLINRYRIRACNATPI